MNEWEMIAWVSGISSVIFGVVWLLVQDVKKGVHKRIDRCEHAIDVFITDCGNTKKDFITVAKWTATIQAQAKTNAENILQVDKNRLLLYGRVIQLEDDAHEFNEMFTVLRTQSYN